MVQKDSALGGPLLKTLYSSQSLSIYRGIMDTAIGKTFFSLLYELSQQDWEQLKVLKQYHALLGLLLEDIENSPPPVIGNAWQNFILNFVLEDANPFSRAAQKSPLKDMNTALLKTVKHDLTMLQQMYQVGPLLEETFSLLKNPGYPDWKQVDIKNSCIPFYRDRKKIKALLHQAPQWADCLEELVAFHHKHSYGIFTYYLGFKWTNGLKGIPNPDPIKLENLVGYENERGIVIKNTKNFLAGGPANNVLLYGDRGTGKSSTVKALLNEFWQQGLRIVEINKGYLSQLPELLDLLRQRPQKFILFIDDLSFESTENEYLTLKALLEGTLEIQPKNVVIYATSNRRHLIKEVTSDRNTSLVRATNEDFRAQDTLQEKLSLADRFGITVIFPSPDQHTYLSIVKSLARQRGLDIDAELLTKKALQWAMLQNGRSGRTARQFIDNLEGEICRRLPSDSTSHWTPLS